VRAEVAYAGPEGQWLLTVDVPNGSTIADAIAASGLRAHVPDARIDDAHVGVFSRPATLATVLREGDRVEIYRALLADPKDVRRRRAQRQRGR
jgi:putative ubiquitin-RnfH superfamily antitoxin RatB of RatAB toxin-antitoxin module